MSQPNSNDEQFSQTSNSCWENSEELVKTLKIGAQDDGDAFHGKAVCKLVNSIAAYHQNQQLQDICEVDPVLKVVYDTMFEIDGETKDELDITGSWDYLLYIDSLQFGSHPANSQLRIGLIEAAIALYIPRVLVVADEKSLEVPAKEWVQLGFRRIAGSSLVFREPACGLRPQELSDAVLRTVMIKNELGFRWTDPAFSDLAGTPDEREANVGKIRELVVATCARYGGRLSDEDVQHYVDTGYDGRQPEVERIEFLFLDFEFPDRRAARRAGAEIRDAFEVYGVSQFDPNAPEGLTAKFVISDDQDVHSIEAIQCHIAEVCDRLDAEVLNKSKFVGGTGVKSFLYEVLFESEEDVATAITELRNDWDFDQLHFEWCFLPRRFPDELSEQSDIEVE